MAQTTLQDLLAESIDTLTAIVDGTTPANKIYVSEKVIAPMKFMAEGGFPDGYKWLGDDLGDPFYDNLQTLLSAIGSGDVVGLTVDLIVRYYRQLILANRTITASRSNTLIIGEDKNEFQINVDIDPITTPLSNMKFKDLTIVFANGSKTSGCSFDNCILKAGDGSITLINTFVSNCFLDEIAETFLESSTIEFSKLKTTLNFTDTVNKVYGCYYNVVPTNEENNQTKDVNFHISNL